MSPKSVFLTITCIAAAYLTGFQVSGADGRVAVAAATHGSSFPPATVNAPDPGESYRITFYTDGRLPYAEGVSMDEATGQRYWAGPQDPGIEPGKSAKDYLDESSKLTVETYRDNRGGQPPKSGPGLMHPPYETHCHRWIYPGPVLVHC